MGLIGQLIVGDDEGLENQLLKRRCGTTDGRIDSKHQGKGAAGVFVSG